jgi:putative transposase
VVEANLTTRQHRHAALKFLRKAMKRYGKVEIVATDRLHSFRAAMSVIGSER